MHKGMSSTLKRKRTASPAGPELTGDSDDKDNDQPEVVRPIVLVGHSLGGIVIKEAICQMCNGDEADRVNAKSIRGILFFGVPSQGMDIKSLRPMVGNQPNQSLLETLGKNSDFLLSQLQRFEASFDFGASSVHFFFETMESPTAKQEHGTWTMSGPPTILVGPHSATQGRYREPGGTFIHPVNCTHSEMVKFKHSDDETYGVIVDCLRQIQKESGKFMKERFTAGNPSG
ncbi:hypothetical protein SLS56_009305 [Neofusicoccum ribis]|uniref:DUF676 domain-containing protein n=1 Tax=Neofusicoccum ribis TaxID=45134 RepID=A0ABR3SHL2_9PEZI